jgi:hypothetical protein
MKSKTLYYIAMTLFILGCISFTVSFFLSLLWMAQHLGEFLQSKVLGYSFVGLAFVVLALLFWGELIDEDARHFKKIGKQIREKRDGS